MRILALCLTLLLFRVPAKAQANLCDPSWLATATAAQARALIQAGADVNRVCNGNDNRPLHQAILNDNVAPGVIQVLVDAGADALAENIDGSSPLDFAERRLDRAMREHPRGSPAYRREEMIYTAVNRYFESDRASAVSDAHAKLCDLNWWRSSASGPAVKELLAIPGVDPNTVCNLSNDRPIHLPLKLTSFVMLTRNINFGIEALVDGSADLNARNNSRQSARSLAEARFDRVRDRTLRHHTRWCNGAISNRQAAEEVRKNGPDSGVYLYITAASSGLPRDEVNKQIFWELFRVDVGGRVTKEGLCPHIGIPNYR